MSQRRPDEDLDDLFAPTPLAADVAHLVALLEGSRRSPPPPPMPPCGARTRRGKRCKQRAVRNELGIARNGRCRMHGGWSTGPRTKRGKDRIRIGNRKRARIRRLAGAFGAGEAIATEGAGKGGSLPRSARKGIRRPR